MRFRSVDGSPVVAVAATSRGGVTSISQNTLHTPQTDA